MYPMLGVDATLSTVAIPGSDAERYLATNRDGREFVISRRLFDILMQADGTRPLPLSKESIQNLKRHGLLQTSRYVSCPGLFNRFILLPLGSRINKCRPFFRVINRLLPPTSLLLLTVSIFLHLFSGPSYFYAENLLLYFGFVLFSIASHEIGHLIAGVSANYEFSEMGFLLLWILPVGAYVAHGENEHAAKKEKLQLSLSGIEMNLLLAGLFRILSSLIPSISGTLFCISIANILLAVFNAIPAKGLDGESALCALTGLVKPLQTAKRTLFRKNRVKRMLHGGPRGIFDVCVLGFVLLSNAAALAIVTGDILCLFFRFL